MLHWKYSAIKKVKPVVISKGLLCHKDKTGDNRGPRFTKFQGENEYL